MVRVPCRLLALTIDADDPRGLAGFWAGFWVARSSKTLSARDPDGNQFHLA